MDTVLPWLHPLHAQRLQKIEQSEHTSLCSKNLGLTTRPHVTWCLQIKNDYICSLGIASHTHLPHGNARADGHIPS